MRVANLDEDVLPTLGVVSANAVTDDVDVVEESAVVVRPLPDRRQIVHDHLNLCHFEVYGLRLTRVRSSSRQSSQFACERKLAASAMHTIAAECTVAVVCL